LEYNEISIRIKTGRLYNRMIYLIAITFILYVGYVWLRYGIQDSISKSYYVVKPKWLFILFCFLCGGGLFYMAYCESWLLVLSGICLMFVGALPDIKYEFVKERHYVAAISCVILSQVYVFIHNWKLSVLFLILSLIMYIYRRRVKELWFIEIIAFLTLIITLYYG